MSLSVRTRFEVFKRDRFTCSYCGRTPPEILLEVDHILPRAAGGTDDIANLTTACATCNRGKAARLLEEGTAPVVGRATVEELAERVEQAKAYMELLGGLQSVIDSQVQMVYEAWARAFGATVVEDANGSKWQLHGWGEMWPNEHSLRRVLRTLTLADVLEAVDIAAAKMRGEPNSHATAYFFGVCHRSIKEGRSPSAGPSPAVAQAEIDQAFEDGRRKQSEAIRDYLMRFEEHGHASLADALSAIWPSDE